MRLRRALSSKILHGMQGLCITPVLINIPSLPAVYVVIVIYCIVTMSAMYNLLSPFVALIPLFNSCRYV